MKLHTPVVFMQFLEQRNCTDPSAQQRCEKGMSKVGLQQVETVCPLQHQYRKKIAVSEMMTLCELKLSRCKLEWEDESHSQRVVI